MKNTFCLIIIILIMGFLSTSVAQKKKSFVKSPQKNPSITFIELGSINCIPCKKMQPVLKAIEEKYGNQITVIFYDVWKDEQKQYAEKFGIKLIPTQIFLDENKKEFFRHEGFYPESEIDRLLQSKGLKIVSEAKQN